MAKKLQDFTADYLRECIIDCNTHDRRFFRCWLDGSYGGEGVYHANCEYLMRNHARPRTLRAFVISEWCHYIAHENDCSAGTVQRHMVNTLSRERLEQLNAELIDDALDLIRDQLDEVAA